MTILSLIIGVLLAALVGFLAGRDYQMTCQKKVAWFDKATRTKDMRTYINRKESSNGIR